MATIEKMVVEIEAGSELAAAMEGLAKDIQAAKDSNDILQARTTGAETRLNSIAKELSKTNERMDDLVADREKHQKRLDDRLEEVIEATQEAEMAFLVRIDKAEKRALAYEKRNANLVRDMKNDGDTD